MEEAKIRFKCSNCGKNISVSDKFAGKAGVCPGCKEVFIVPKPKSISEIKSDNVKVKKTIKLNCPYCKTRFEVPGLLMGKTSFCPNCNRNIFVGQNSIKPMTHDSTEPEQESVLQVNEIQRRSKNCLYCGEEILEQARKCKHCGEMQNTVGNSYNYMSANQNTRAHSAPKTDIFAVLCFATGIVGFFILPIIFTPMCYIAGIISHYRMKDNPDLKGNGIRIVGALLGIASMVYLLFQFGYFDDLVSQMKDSLNTEINYTESAPEHSDGTQEYLASMQPFYESLKQMNRRYEIGFNIEGYRNEVSNVFDSYALIQNTGEFYLMGEISTLSDAIIKNHKKALHNWDVHIQGDDLLYISDNLRDYHLEQALQEGSIFINRCDKLAELCMTEPNDYNFILNMNALKDFVKNCDSLAKIDCSKYASMVNDILRVNPKEEQLAIIRQALELEGWYRVIKGSFEQALAVNNEELLNLASKSYKDSQKVSDKLIALCKQHLRDNSDIIVEEAKKELNKE